MHSPMSAPAPSRVMRYLTVILRWLLIAIAVFVLTVRIGGYITDNLLPKVYKATARSKTRKSTKKRRKSR